MTRVAGEQLAIPYNLTSTEDTNRATQPCRPGIDQCAWNEPVEYLRRLSLEERRASGHVYTPPHLVVFVLQRAGYARASEFTGRPLLDPACGAGAFLVGAVLAIAARLRSDGYRLDHGDERSRFLSIVETTLFGVDIDPKACALALAAVKRAVAHVSPGPLPDAFFRGNISEADFLTTPRAALRKPAADGFAYVVGNPPYVSATRISAQYKERIRTEFETAGGRLDLYTVFLERSLTLLALGGRLAMVTPDKYLASQSARALRAFILKHGALRTIARFRSHKVFEGAATVPCVTVVERAGQPRSVLVETCAEKPDNRGRVVVSQSARVPARSFGPSPWALISPRLLELARRIQNRRTLSGVSIRISAGPATGCDSLYVFPSDARPELEPELLSPAVRGRDIVAFEIRDPHLSILLPYTFANGSRSSELVDLRRYPKIRAYLEFHRQRLERRHCVRVWEKQWYDLHDRVWGDLGGQPKVLVPDVANQNRFAVDEGRFIPLHSAYYIVPKPGVDPHFLAAVLNSRVTLFLIRLLAPVVKDGFNRYRRQFLAALPVPAAALAEARRIGQAARDCDATTADEVVMDLFQLTPADRRLLNDFLEYKSENARLSLGAPW
jgi:methylase of polypeptide subunit release factors